MTDLAYSTILKKGPAATNTKSTDQLLKMSQMFERSLTAAGARGPGIHTVPGGMSQSEKLIYTDKQDLIPVIICKKGKKSGKNLYREGRISRRDVFHFAQSKHNKSYGTPLDFIAESKEQFMSASQAATSKTEKKALLPWDAKEVSAMPYRIRFRRHNTGQEGPSDTAFYFDNPQEWRKMMNFLKGISLLEKNSPEGAAGFSRLLKALSDRFRENAIVKFRQAIHLRAQILKQSMVQKDVLIKQSLLLTQFNSRLLKSMVPQWQSIAHIRDRSNKKNEQDKLDRKNKLESAVNRCNVLTLLNHRLMSIMSEAWNTAAQERAQSNREDVNVLFNLLELPSTITKPSVKIDVKVLRDLPDLLRLNGKLLQGKSREFKLSCNERAGSQKELVKFWSISAGAQDISEEQKKFVREAYIPSNANLDGNRFSLHFEDFSLEQLNNVEININVFDDSRILKAYHYTTLLGLHLASKKGKNTWLCLNSNEPNCRKLPLLHLKVETKVARAQAGAKGRPKLANVNVIEDTFYNYSFRMPNVTPDRRELLELLPARWSVIDAEARNLDSTRARAEYVQRVKYRLAKHYHQTTGRQIARLKKSAYMWADLQEDIASYFPDHSAEDNSQLYVSDDYLKSLTNQTYHPERSSGHVVSYLFKRDLWESKDGWRHYYDCLERLCKKGLPPQNRLDIWSQMSRVAYFINLTEDQGLADLQKAGISKSTGLNPDEELPIRSRKIYELLKEGSQKSFSLYYQNLEDDIVALRELFGVQKLAHESCVRNICRVFIYWSKIFSDPAKDQRSQYFITYSRTVATLCYGFLVCQTCSFVEGNTGADEHQVFWLLISLVTYILSSYFETNEKSAAVDTLTFKQKDDLHRRRNTLTNSALRCNQVKGIKSDLLLLKYLLRDYQPEIHQKFEELGLPLEYYFGDYMLSMFFTLFNPGLTFRIWDVLMFEGSSANQVKCNRMIVCIIYTLLKECKHQILAAKEAGDIGFIIEIYARFQTSYGDFIKKTYETCNEFLNQKVPTTETVVGKLNLIKYALFSNEYNKLDNETQKAESVIESHFRSIHSQNLELFKFARQNFAYKTGTEAETLSYSILAYLIRNFTANYGNPVKRVGEPQNIQATEIRSEGSRKLVRERVTEVWVKVFSTTSPIEEVRKTSLVVNYGLQKLSVKDFNPLVVGLEGVFDTKALLEGATRELRVELWDERDPARPRRLKFVNVDLKGIPLNVVTKLNLRFNEEDPDIYSENFVATQIELAVLLESAQDAEHPRPARKHTQPLLITDLEDIYYREFKSNAIHSSIVADMALHEGLNENILNQYSVLRRSPEAWKENFAMASDDFVNTMREIAPFWSDHELRSIHKSVTKASRNGVFYIVDFFILLILYVKATINQKYSLLFEVITAFDSDLLSSKGEIPLYAVKGLCCHLYDLFMIHIPYNQLENMIDLAATGHASCVKNVIINEQVESSKVSYPKQVLNKISNFVHLNSYGKDIHVQTAEILRFLKNVYEKEVLPTVEGRHSLLSQNTIDIIYFNQGQNHRMTLYVDQNWKPQPQQLQDHERYVSRLLACYKDVLPLTIPSSLYSKEQFMQILQRLPMLNYLCSFENSDPTTFLLMGDNKFTILLEGEQLVTIRPNYKPLPPKQPTSLTSVQPGAKKRDKFAAILRNWPGISRGYANRGRPSSPNKVKSDAITVPAHKVDVFFPLSKIMENIKRGVMREIAENWSQAGNLDSYHSRIFNENLFWLDYDVTIVLNKTQRFTGIDKSMSPFLAMLEYLENGKNYNGDVLKNLEIIFNMKSTVQHNTFGQYHGQLAVYRHSDGSSEWLPCQIVYKFQFGTVDENIDNERIDGYGVTFERFPGETFIKKAAEVIVSDPLDMDELLLKRVDKTTYRATTVDQIAKHMIKSSTFNQPGRGATNAQAGGNVVDPLSMKRNY